MKSETEIREYLEDCRNTLDDGDDLRMTESACRGEIAALETILEAPTQDTCIDVLRTWHAKTSTYYSWLTPCRLIPFLGTYIHKKAHYYDGMLSADIFALDEGPARTAENGEKVIDIDGETISLEPTSGSEHHYA